MGATACDRCGLAMTSYAASSALAQCHVACDFFRGCGTTTEHLRLSAARIDGARYAGFNNAIGAAVELPPNCMVLTAAAAPADASRPQDRHQLSDSRQLQATIMCSQVAMLAPMSLNRSSSLTRHRAPPRCGVCQSSSLKSAA